jgi:hypothetical protein
MVDSEKRFVAQSSSILAAQYTSISWIPIAQAATAKRHGYCPSQTVLEIF